MGLEHKREFGSGDFGVLESKVILALASVLNWLEHRPIY